MMMRFIKLVVYFFLLRNTLAKKCPDQNRVIAATSSSFSSMPTSESSCSKVTFSLIQGTVDQISCWQAEHRESDVSGRPFVTLTFAQSMDAKIAIYDNEEGDASSNFAISGKESLLLTHALRSIHDAILVGGRTLAIDNPRLNNRLWSSNIHQPRPIVLDTQLRYLDRLSGSCRATNLIVCCSEQAAMNNRRSIPPGICLLPSQLDKNGTVDIDLLLKELANKFGLKSIMVEGGSKVLTSFAQKELVDCLCVTISPKILGTRGLGAFPFNVNHHLSGYDLVAPRFISLGNDCVLLSKWLGTSVKSEGGTEYTL